MKRITTTTTQPIASVQNLKCGYCRSSTSCFVFGRSRFKPPSRQHLFCSFHDYAQSLQPNVKLDHNTSFHILSNYLFTNCPIIRHYTRDVCVVYNNLNTGCFTTLGHNAGGDFLGFCDQKSSYKHVSDLGRIRSYGRFLIPVHALV